ncbi:COA8 family protein CG14806, mitochondrial [Chelonus insularis]|uniref:COA8 family protein CG14806, mitochondrial n=1 Tax=Chelonus insularis TaxID=460826 RepID=UPI00158DB16B|nr:COA8 family protein CG14806, mitochondrial [Chelonus insularis]
MNLRHICPLWSYQRWNHFRYSHSLHSSNSKFNLVKNTKTENADVIGPPDEISNLRPIIFAKSKNETKLEKEYREMREDTQNWNQQFWSEHNSRFITERKQFQKGLNKNDGSITADQMSIFYKSFLDKNWKTHLNYNISWYKKNFRIVFLELRVRLSKFKFK